MQIYDTTQRAATHEPQLGLKPKAVSKVSGMPERFVYREIKEGRLRAIWCGRGWLVPRSALVEFLEKASVRESASRARKARREKQPEELLPPKSKTLQL